MAVSHGESAIPLTDGDVVVHDGEVGRRGGVGHEFAGLRDVDGVVEGRDDHQGRGTGVGSLGGEVDAFFGGEGADAGDNGDAVPISYEASLQLIPVA